MVEKDHVVLHVTPDRHFAQRFVVPVAECQVAEGNTVDIVSWANDYPESAAQAGAGQTPTHINLNLKVRSAKFSVLFNLVVLVRLIRSRKYRVVIFHTSVDSLLPLTLAAIFCPFALRVYFNHGVPFIGHGGFYGLVLRFIERANLCLANRVVTVSKSMAEILRNIRPHHRDIRAIYPGSACGVDLSYFDLTKRAREARDIKSVIENRVRVLYIGRPEVRKGLTDLMRAFESIATDSSWELVLVGPSEAEVEGLSVGKSKGMLTAHGYVADIREHLLTATILCAPSHHEGLGYTLLEAAAAGVPIVCSSILGHSDFIRSGENGITFAPRDSTALATAIKNLVLNKTLCARLAGQAYTDVQAFDRSLVAPRVAAIIAGAAL